MIDPHWMYWLWPVIIFCARVTDVGLSTMRILFISQGRTRLAAATGFVESLIWISVVAQTFRHLDNPLCILGYAGGFATGNALGMHIERKLAMGMQVVRIITQSDAAPLLQALQAADFGTTVVDAEGARGKVKLVFTVVRRRDVPRISQLIKTYTPRAFISIEDVRRAEEGVFPRSGPWGLGTTSPSLWAGMRKGK